MEMGTKVLVIEPDFTSTGLTYKVLLGEFLDYYQKEYVKKDTFCMVLMGGEDELVHTKFVVEDTPTNRNIINSTIEELRALERERIRITQEIFRASINTDPSLVDQLPFARDLAKYSRTLEELNANF